MSLCVHGYLSLCEIVCMHMCLKFVCVYVSATCRPRNFFSCLLTCFPMPSLLFHCDTWGFQDVVLRTPKATPGLLQAASGVRSMPSTGVSPARGKESHFTQIPAPFLFWVKSRRGALSNMIYLHPKTPLNVL